MRGVVWLWIGLPATLTLGAGLLLASSGNERFPHEKHERLFPLCEGCHAGIASGDGSDVYPTEQTCLQCHDGTVKDRVVWSPPDARSSNLRFSHLRHSEHTRSLATGSLPCQGCHALPDASRRMEVGAPRPELCVSCHAHQAASHLDTDAICSTCHVPLAEARTLSSRRIADLPVPAWHRADDFISTHGRLASARTETCATCHARQSCERCHQNSASLPPIQVLAPDARVAALEGGRAPRYPTPQSHGNVAWRLVHGDSAMAGISTCANCHARNSCANCHMGGSGAANVAVRALPPGDRPGRGVSVDRGRASVHPAGFARTHGAAAASGQLTCTQCHSTQSCAGCHAGQDSRSFHAANFVERHATDVFGGTSNCQSCHNTERFCRDCHTRTGIAAGTGMNAAFHTGQPMWILSHGQAARMGMQSCASCHRQNDCVRCHSAVGGWGVNPHGAGFPAERLSSRSPASCSACHSGTPGRGRP